ncbi:MAG: hypothetical protein WCA12_04140 [Burkholderiales bacterium]
MRVSLTAASVMTALAMSMAPALAQTAAPAPQQSVDRVCGYDLLTPEEQRAFREQMQSASTTEARAKVQDEYRALVEARAKEQGVTLAEPRGPGYGLGAGRGPGYGRFDRGVYSQLFTQEERDKFREEMRNAKTREERQTVAAEHRALAEARAKEKGITPLPPGPGYGPGYGRFGGGVYSELFTPEEREKLRDQMRAAKTLEERQMIRDSHRALAEVRAKEKGVALPPDRGFGRGPGPHYGPRHGYDQQLFSADERKVYWNRMQAATTPEERQTIRDEHRALAEARAKEKGIAFPERGIGCGPGGRGPGFGPGGPGCGYGPGGRGPGYGPGGPGWGYGPGGPGQGYGPRNGCNSGLEPAPATPDQPQS